MSASTFTTPAADSRGKNHKGRGKRGKEKKGEEDGLLPSEETNATEHILAMANEDASCDVEYSKSIYTACVQITITVYVTLLPRLTPTWPKSAHIMQFNIIDQLYTLGFAEP